MKKENFVSMRAGVWEDTGIKQCFGTFISNFYLTLLESVLNDSLDTCPLTETPRSLFVTLTEEKKSQILKSECSNQSTTGSTAIRDRFSVRARKVKSSASGIRCVPICLRVFQFKNTKGES